MKVLAISREFFLQIDLQTHMCTLMNRRPMYQQFGLTGSRRPFVITPTIEFTYHPEKTAKPNSALVCSNFGSIMIKYLDPEGRESTLDKPKRSPDGLDGLFQAPFKSL